MELDETLTQLRAALSDAMHERDQPAISALRSAISALENAQAVPTDERAGAIESSAYGVGGAETQRRELTEHEVRYLLEAEVDQRESTAASFERLGQYDRAERLRAEADALSPWVN